MSSASHLFLFALAGLSAVPLRAEPPPPPVLLNYTNHWAGNTGGRGGVGANANVVSNFIVDFAVLNAGQVDWQMAPHVPLAITKSYWDETRWGHGAYSKGVRVSKGEFFFKLITWDSSTANGVTATIAHPRALDAVQQNLEDQGCPLTDYSDNLPYVALSDNRTIRSVAYPTGIAFDKTGRLWVADNGPDQNFKIFNVPTSGAPVLVDTFGETGGVFAGPVKGRLGPKRFWGVRGVGFGDDGQIIVGCSGIPGQTQGGTDVRWFDPTGTTMNHQAIGTFMHVADFDPASDGRDLHASAVRYAMDYTKPPGESWSYAAVTLDPFRFPEDPRLFMPMETAYVRWIGGRKFLFCTSMHLRYLAVFRFEEGSEIAIPAALLYLLDDGQGKKWAQGLYPTWTVSANPRRRYMWVDANGDGRPAAGEFSEFEVANHYSKAYDVDADGNLWMGGGMAPYSSYWKQGGVWVLPCLGLDANGVPRYDGTKVERIGVPQALLDPLDHELSRAPTRVRYQKETDTLLVAAGLDSYFPLRVYVIDGYRYSPNPTRRCLIDLGHDRNGAWAIRLDQGTAEMSLPSCLAADDEYLYVAYLDGGRDEHMRGEVTVYDLRDGHQVGWMTPTADTNFECGATDLLVGLQVAKRADGSRVICLEDNGGGKVMVYHWIPSSPAGIYPSTTGGDAVGPVIVTPPPRIVLAAYQRTLALKPVVVGRNLQYQWAKDGVDLPGAIAVHFTKANITEADAGRYTLRAWNNDRTVTSTAAEVSLVYPPVITTQPAARTEFTPGNAVTLSVGATGTTLAYQWYKDGKAVSRANASTLKIAAAAAGDAGTYTVVVSNFIEAVTSAGALVQPYSGPPEAFPGDFKVALAPVAGQGGQFQIVFGPVQPGFIYTPETCTDLAAGNWLALFTYDETNNGTQRTITDRSASGARRFYRIRATPAP